ncbi:2-polyprenyl-6-methoxyphenol hydroxylase [Arachidicoccus ginsenosidimutans]|uniref:FAD-dependent oxidoreductase n=1 Tax=Arachidicoccus sp. BS20 TaxID=1850526 RepID=UPI0007F17EC7|nr:NAD(P)/FAD-dependent oxidoreductase [Arachidicoccus sp. BS20]ANI87909.1 2-polyprenyl-6-methoxyphenol hydroxylase [Arachidicoccus sp. BS20]
MLLQNKQVAIVGGGMAGLTLARLLQLKDVDVKVYERDFSRDIRVQGSTLDLHEGTGLEAMKRAGLLDEFYKHHRPDASKMLLADRKLNIKFDEKNFAKITAETRPEIDRAPLRDILLDSLKPSTVVWNSNFISMEKEKNGWRIHFKNGTSAYADLVVAADGANSKIRPYLSDIKPIYSGITLIQIDIDHAEKNIPQLLTATKGGKIMCFDNEQMLGFGTKADGSIMAIAAFKTHENWLKESGIDFNNKQQVFDWFKKEFADWNEKWYELFTNDEVTFTPRPQYYFPFNQSWETQENLTMIGDATHRMPPFAGEGANVAMQDSFELAEVLTNGKFADIKTAIAYFEKDMVARGAEATQGTLENTERMFAKNGLEQMVSFFNGVHQQ